MKLIKYILTLLLLFIAISSYFTDKCEIYGYEVALIGTEVFCVKTNVTENYVVHQIESLNVLQGDADRYKLLPKPTPKPLDTETG